jgi:hypothetical protein
MENTTAQRIASRFAGLPADKRREFLQRMQEQGVSFGQLPIPPAAERKRASNCRMRSSANGSSGSSIHRVRRTTFRRPCVCTGR